MEQIFGYFGIFSIGIICGAWIESGLIVRMFVEKANAKFKTPVKVDNEFYYIVNEKDYVDMVLYNNKK